jgi:hypothetical protein
MRTIVLTLTCCTVLGFPAVNAQTSFKDVESRTAFGRAKEGDGGRLLVGADAIRFVKNNQRDEYFATPPRAVNDLFYSRVSGRRIGAAIMVSPLLLFSKGRKHYLTISFNDGKDLVGAVEFKLHKSNYRGVLRACEQVTGLTMQYDQEGIKDEKQQVASRAGGAGDDAGLVEFSSVPEGAEIEVDGQFIGSTPRKKQFRPGEYKIKISKSGYKTWERKIAVEAGETVPIRAELEQ